MWWWRGERGGRLMGPRGALLQVRWRLVGRVLGAGLCRKKEEGRRKKEEAELEVGDARRKRARLRIVYGGG